MSERRDVVPMAGALPRPACIIYHCAPPPLSLLIAKPILEFRVREELRMPSTHTEHWSLVIGQTDDRTDLSSQEFIFNFSSFFSIILLLLLITTGLVVSPLPCIVSKIRIIQFVLPITRWTQGDKPPQELWHHPAI